MRVVSSEKHCTVCLTFCVLYSVTLLIFCTYLGDQLRWANFLFLVARHSSVLYRMLFFSLYCILHSWLIS